MAEWTDIEGIAWQAANWLGDVRISVNRERLHAVLFACRLDGSPPTRDECRQFEGEVGRTMPLGIRVDAVPVMSIRLRSGVLPACIGELPLAVAISVNELCRRSVDTTVMLTDGGEVIAMGERGHGTD
jgi:hypothetical protein